LVVGLAAAAAVATPSDPVVVAVTAAGSLVVLMVDLGATESVAAEVGALGLLVDFGGGI
jgi:hypothetical protein